MEGAAMAGVLDLGSALGSGVGEGLEWLSSARATLDRPSTAPVRRPKKFLYTCTLDDAQSRLATKANKTKERERKRREAKARGKTCASDKDKGAATSLKAKHKQSERRRKKEASTKFGPKRWRAPENPQGNVEYKLKVRSGAIFFPRTSR